MDESVEGSYSGEDSLSMRRRRQYANMGRSISMATVQAQVSLAQSLRNLFASAHNNDSIDGHHSSSTAAVEDIWLQAVYNTVVLSIFGVFLCILIAVYFILEPFLHPILWAVLIGAFLFPFKRGSTSRIETWLEYMDTNGVPLSIGMFLSPLYTLHLLTNSLERIIINFWKLITFLVIITLLCYLSLHFDVFELLYRVIGVFFHSYYTVDHILRYTKHLQVMIIILGLPLLVLYTNYTKDHPSLPIILQSLVVTLWYLILINAATLSIGPFGIALVTILFTIAGLGYVIQYNKREEEEEDQGEIATKDYSRRRKSVLGDAYSMIQDNIVRPSFVFLNEKKKEREKEEERVSSVCVSTSQKGEGEREEESHDKLGKKSTVRFKSVEEPITSNFIIPPDAFQPTTDTNDDTNTTGTVSNKIFLILITSCTVLLLLRHWWLLLLTIPLALGWCIKWLLHFSITGYLYKLACSYMERFKAWCCDHQEKLFPQPVPTLLQLCIEFDNLILMLLKSTAGSVVSTLIIIGLLLGSVGISAFLLFQIQLEISHTVGLATQLLNNSLVDNNHWIQNIIGQNNSVQAHIEQLTGQGFHYGREWLGSQIQGAVADNMTRDHILKLYDTMYHAYVFHNSTSKDAVIGSKVNGSVFINDDQIWSQAKYFLSENFETIISIVQSLWSLVSVNISLGISLITSFFSIIFSGGTLLLNFVVFITTLFYLLTYSEDIYLPIKWILDVLPNIISEANDSSHYADMFTSVIQSVFIASLRRAFFYGLYTWLILSIFGMKIIILPSVLASLAGAVPFVGPYWVGVPSILQLWLVEGSLFQALIVLGLFLLPPFIIDSLINSEIEGSHPYLTGLAIAGGVYFTGLEGAIFGPILLCVLLFIMNLLTDNK